MQHEPQQCLPPATVPGALPKPADNEAIMKFLLDLKGQMDEMRTEVKTIRAQLDLKMGDIVDDIKAINAHLEAHLEMTKKDWVLTPS